MSCPSQPATGTVSLQTLPAPTVTVIQPTCDVLTGTIEVTSPIAAGGITTPADLFISEVTDADTGSLTYVEIYNGTGNPIDLANYKLKIFNFGTNLSNPVTLSCDLDLSGTIANNATIVVKVSSNANQVGVSPDLTFTTCGGVNNNDYIKLTSNSDVDIDLWGRTDGTIYTPNNQPGYTYRRINTAIVPSLIWNPSDWNSIDPEDYSNIGSYSTIVVGYEYSLDNGTYQSGTTFTNVSPGLHTITVLDLNTGCFSLPFDVIIDPVPQTPTFGTLTATTPVCSGGDAIFALSGTANATVTYTINTGTNQTVVLDATGNATVTINAVTADTSILLSQISLGTCNATLSNTATVVVSPNPTFGNLTATTPVCSGGDAIFTLSGTSNATVTYTINSGANQTVVLDATGSATITINAVTADTTILLSQITLGTCNTTLSTTATVVVSPNPTFGTLTATTPICSGGNAVFTLSGTANATVTYTINTGTNQTVVLDASGNATVTINAVTADTSILLSQISLATCNTTISTTATVVVSPNPTFGNLTAVTPICSGEDAEFTLSGTANSSVTYSINTGANQTVVLDATGNATVSLNSVTADTTILLSQISLGTCNTTISNTATVTVNDIPQVTISGGCVGPFYTLTASPIGNSFDPNSVTYSWEDSTGNPIGGNTQNIEVSEEGDYSVTVTSNGCSGISAAFNADSITCVIQKGISVNSTPDGLNDCFDLEGFNVKKLSIFNRYGMKVYSRNEYTNQWCGQSDNGDELPDGTYYYVIERDNGETNTGWIYINKEN